MRAGFLVWSNGCSVEATVASKNHARAACCGLGRAWLLRWSNGCFNGATVASMNRARVGRSEQSEPGRCLRPGLLGLHLEPLRVSTPAGPGPASLSQRQPQHPCCAAGGLHQCPRQARRKRPAKGQGTPARRASKTEMRPRGGRGIRACGPLGRLRTRSEPGAARSVCRRVLLGVSLIGLGVAQGVRSLAPPRVASRVKAKARRPHPFLLGLRPARAAASGAALAPPRGVSCQRTEPHPIR